MCFFCLECCVEVCDDSSVMEEERGKERVKKIVKISLNDYDAVWFTSTVETFDKQHERKQTNKCPTDNKMRSPHIDCLRFADMAEGS